MIINALEAVDPVGRRRRTRSFFC